MLLLPGSLPADRATLKALCVGLDESTNIAAQLKAACVEPFSGSWSDAEREALGLTGDLMDGRTLATTLPFVNNGIHSYAVATPVHAVLGLTDLTPLDPALISLDVDASRALCEAADLHLSTEGVRLSFVDTNTWLVSCANQVSALTERPDWLIGEPLRPSLPRGKDARRVERWMNELQMLLFAHPVNVSREERGLPPINVVWLWGFGANNPNDEVGTVGAAPPRPNAEVSNVGRGSAAPTIRPPHVDHLNAVRKGDVPAWQSAWQKYSSEILSCDSIILGDSRPRLRVTPRKASAIKKITALFQRKTTLEHALATLQQQL